MEAHTHTHTKPKPLEKVERETAELITKIDKVVTTSPFPGHHSQPFFVAFNEWVSPLKFRLFRTRTEPGSWDPTVRDWDQRFFFFFIFDYLFFCNIGICIMPCCHVHAHQMQINVVSWCLCPRNTSNVLRSEDGTSTWYCRPHRMCRVLWFVQFHAMRTVFNLLT